MTTARVLALVSTVAAVFVLGGVANGSAQPQPSGPPDTYITSWDTVGNQAVSAAGLTPPEGHLIFAYVAIAVYDAVMAIEGGYEPFAIDVDAPEDASPQAAVAAAAHRILAHYLPAQAPTIIDPAYVTSLATIPAGPAKTHGIAVGESVAQLLIAQRSDDGFRAPVTYTPPSPPIRACGSDRDHAPITPPSGCAAVQLDSADQFGLADRRRSTPRSGHGSTTRSRRSDRARARPGRLSRPWLPGSGGSRRCRRHVARSGSSSSTINWTSAMRRGSWRWSR